MADVTLPGAGGGTISVPVNEQFQADLQGQLSARPIGQVVAGGSLPTVSSPATVVFTGAAPFDGPLNLTADIKTVVIANNQPATVNGGTVGDALIVSGEGGLNASFINGNATVFASGGNNQVNSSWDSSRTEVSTGAGDDTIRLHSGSGVVQSVGGNNSIMAKGNFQVTTGGGNDQLWVASGANTIAAGGGDNRLHLQTGANTVTLGDGNDTLIAKDGSSTIFAGAGNDQIWVDGGSHNIDMGSGKDTVQLRGGTGSEVRLGGGGTVSALQGNNTIHAGSGSAWITGGAGNMTVHGGAGSTTLQNAAGGLNFIGGAGGATVNGGAGSATITGGAGGGYYVGGASGNNSLTAGFGKTTLIAGGNGDTLVAAGADGDVLKAASGNVTLLGGTSTGQNWYVGKDGDATMSIVGGSGSEFFVMGRGNATVTGAEGRDVFQFFKNAGGINNNTVTITDFTIGVDRLSFQGFGAVADAVTDHVSVGGSTTLTLSDGTTLVLSGVENNDLSKLTA